MQDLTMTDLPDMDEVLIIAPTHPDGYEAICETANVSRNAIQRYCDEHYPELDVHIEDSFAGTDLVTITE